MMWKGLIVATLALADTVSAYIHPITVEGHYFIDSVTKEPFYIKGIDYQPGGSSGVTENRDPLSNHRECARDIILFQELGINTIRVYSINADLNHDKCMSMLAAAGIYLVLDVNSPLPNHHLNRYEPWNTYNLDYLENIFKVVEQFSYYNNTLGFFAGNEIVNDMISAKNSPNYVKAVIRDLKEYIKYNSPRFIPVGYSAADDLKFRISFSEFLACEKESASDSVDFYGVNSYQWCGEQTFYTSGYNILVDDYSDYDKPVFFSEYGCNEVTPRVFDEVQALYSSDMIDVFSGGLVYEFNQEANNYGLVEIKDNGDVKILPDFLSLKYQFETLPPINYEQVATSMKKSMDMHFKLQSKQQFEGLPSMTCQETYSNLDTSRSLPPSIAFELIDAGVEVRKGKFVPLSNDDTTCKFNFYKNSGEVYPIRKSIDRVEDYMSGSEITRKHGIKGGFNNGMYKDEESSCDSSSESSEDDSDCDLPSDSEYSDNDIE